MHDVIFILELLSHFLFKYHLILVSLLNNIIMEEAYLYTIFVMNCAQANNFLMNAGGESLWCTVV